MASLGHSMTQHMAIGHRRYKQLCLTVPTPRLAYILALTIFSEIVLSRKEGRANIYMKKIWQRKGWSWFHSCSRAAPPSVYLQWQPRESNGWPKTRLSTVGNMGLKTRFFSFTMLVLDCRPLLSKSNMLLFHSKYLGCYLLWHIYQISYGIWDSCSASMFQALVNMDMFSVHGTHDNFTGLG